MSEIRIHQSLSHPNIVNFKHTFEDSDHVYILLEMCCNQTLNELLKRRRSLTEVEIRCYLVQLIAGIKYLRKQHIVHRDLKLRNLFLTDKMELKIGDFGLAARIQNEGERRKTICGTPNYIAPEVLDSKVGHSYEADIWSLGIVLYTLLIGIPPFKSEDAKTTYSRIKVKDYSFPKDVVISEEARDLITKILDLDPSKRPTPDEILEHEFFAAYSIPKLMLVSTLVYPPSESFLKQYSGTLSTTSIEENVLDENVITKNVKVEAKIEKPLLTELTLQNESRPPVITISEIWIKKWIDYSTKYGMGYLTTNGYVGVNFNDDSKIVLHANKR